MASKGERNNNPGNLEASAWTKSQPGYQGSDGRFAIFDTMANGIAAQGKLLYNRYLKKGIDTPNSIVWKYGNDPGTGDDISVRNYAKYVADRLGINVDDKINPNKVGALAMAMREFETGNTSKGVIDGSGHAGIDMVEGALGEAVNGPADGNSPLVPDFIENLLNGKTAARWASVVIGIILIGLAIAAFVLKTDNVKEIISHV